VLNKEKGGGDTKDHWEGRGSVKFGLDRNREEKEEKRGICEPSSHPTERVKKVRKKKRKNAALT